MRGDSPVLRARIAAHGLLFRHVAAAAIPRGHVLVEQMHLRARISRLLPRRDVVLPHEVMGVARALVAKGAMAARAERRRAQRLQSDARDVRRVRSRIPGGGHDDRRGAERVAPIAVDVRLLDSMAGPTANAGVRPRIRGLDALVHRAVDEQRDVVAASAKPAGLVASFRAESIHGGAIDGVVERRERVRATPEALGHVGVAALAIAAIREILATNRPGGRGLGRRHCGDRTRQRHAEPLPRPRLALRRRRLPRRVRRAAARRAPRARRPQRARHHQGKPRRSPPQPPAHHAILDIVGQACRKWRAV